MTNQTQLLPNCSKEITLSGLLLQPDNYCNQIPTNSKKLYKKSHFDRPLIFLLVTQEQMTNGMLNLSAIPSNYIIKNCPSPFIKDPLAGTGTTVDNKYCRFGCCLPCPAQNYVRLTDKSNGFINTHAFSCIKKDGLRLDLQLPMR